MTSSHKRLEGELRKGLGMGVPAEELMSWVQSALTGHKGGATKHGGRRRNNQQTTDEANTSARGESANGSNTAAAASSPVAGPKTTTDTMTTTPENQGGLSPTALKRQQSAKLLSGSIKLPPIPAAAPLSTRMPPSLSSPSNGSVNVGRSSPAAPNHTTVPTSTSSSATALAEVTAPITATIRLPVLEAMLSKARELARNDGSLDDDDETAGNGAGARGKGGLSNPAAKKLSIMSAGGGGGADGDDANLYYDGDMLPSSDPNARKIKILRRSNNAAGAKGEGNSPNDGTTAAHEMKIAVTVKPAPAAAVANTATSTTPSTITKPRLVFEGLEAIEEALFIISEQQSLQTLKEQSLKSLLKAAKKAASKAVADKEFMRRAVQSHEEEKAGMQMAIADLTNRLNETNKQLERLAYDTVASTRFNPNRDGGAGNTIGSGGGGVPRGAEAQLLMEAVQRALDDIALERAGEDFLHEGDGGGDGDDSTPPFYTSRRSTMATSMGEDDEHTSPVGSGGRGSPTSITGHPPSQPVGASTTSAGGGGGRSPSPVAMSRHGSMTPTTTLKNTGDPNNSGRLPPITSARTLAGLGGGGGNSPSMKSLNIGGGVGVGGPQQMILDGVTTHRSLGGAETPSKASVMLGGLVRALHSPQQWRGNVITNRIASSVSAQQHVLGHIGRLGGTVSGTPGLGFGTAGGFSFSGSPAGGGGGPQGFTAGFSRGGTVHSSHGSISAPTVEVYGGIGIGGNGTHLSTLHVHELQQRVTDLTRSNNMLKHRLEECSRQNKALQTAAFSHHDQLSSYREKYETIADQLQHTLRTTDEQLVEKTKQIAHYQHEVFPRLKAENADAEKHIEHLQEALANVQKGSFTQRLLHEEAIEEYKKRLKTAETEKAALALKLVKKELSAASVPSSSKTGLVDGSNGGVMTALTVASSSPSTGGGDSSDVDEDSSSATPTKSGGVVFKKTKGLVVPSYSGGGGGDDGADVFPKAGADVITSVPTTAMGHSAATTVGAGGGRMQRARVTLEPKSGLTDLHPTAGASPHHQQQWSSVVAMLEDDIAKERRDTMARQGPPKKRIGIPSGKVV